MKVETTESIRVDKKVLKDVRVHVANNGGSIKKFFDAAAKYVLKKKLKMKDNEFYENQSR
jgi:hypothetical protein